MSDTTGSRATLFASTGWPLKFQFKPVAPLTSLLSPVEIKTVRIIKVAPYRAVARKADRFHTQLSKSDLRNHIYRMLQTWRSEVKCTIDALDHFVYELALSLGVALFLEKILDVYDAAWLQDIENAS